MGKKGIARRSSMKTETLERRIDHRLKWPQAPLHLGDFLFVEQWGDLVDRRALGGRGPSRK
jgi:hypothetical protein